MPINVNTNIPALNATRQLQKVQGNLGKSFERLSSGLRINRAADDVGGLKISERFNSQIRGLSQSIRNANDGISLVQTAEGALTETTSILQRLRELSVQASNGTLNSSDRQSLQDEVTQMLSEVDRIAETPFNGQKLFNGSFRDLTIAVTPEAGEGITVSLSGATTNDLGQIANSTGTAVDSNAIADGELKINDTFIRGSANFAGSGPGQTADSAFAKARAINASNANVRAEAQATTVTGNTGVIGDNDDETLTINGVQVFDNSVDSIDSDQKLVDAINAVSDETGVVATPDLITGEITLTAADGSNIDIAAGGTANPFSTGVTQGTIKLTSNDNISFDGQAARIGFTGDEIAVDTNTIRGIDISTIAGATEAISRLDSAIDSVGTQRGELGALQNRLESTVSNLSNVHENVSSAQSRILDVDFASETINLTKNQLLQQAGASMLAQAKASSQIALNLLG